MLLLLACAVPAPGPVPVEQARPADADADGVIAALDCDDDDATVSPLAAEVAYDGVDQDCDGADLTDVDRDGWDAGADCDDADPRVNPSRRELCGDDVDDDCDGVLACADTGDTGDTGGDDTGQIDGDGDGVPAPEDCDDSDADVYPGAADRVGRDMDCDGDATRLDAEDATIVAGPCSMNPGIVSGGGDLDGDGLADAVYTRSACDGETGGAVTLFLGDDFTAPVELTSVDIGARGLVADARGDLDGDGVSDLVYGARLDGDVRMLIGGGGLAGADLDAPDAAITAEGARWRVRTADVDGDGIDDLIVDDTEGGTSGLFYGGALPTGALDDADARVSDADGALHASAAADLDGDGALDLVLGDGTQAGVLRGGGARFAGAYGLLDTTSLYAHSLAGEPRADGVDRGQLGDVICAGDLDGDGVADLVLGDTNRGDGAEPDRLYVFGPGRGAHTESDAWAALEGDVYTSLGAGLWCGDVDRDGVDDVLAGAPWWEERAYTEGAVFWFAGPVLPGTSTMWDATVLAPTWGRSQMGAGVAVSGDHVLVTAQLGAADTDFTAPLWVFGR